MKGPELRAVLEISPSALGDAAALDKERKRSGKRSLLHGIPILLKDNIATMASEGEHSFIRDMSSKYYINNIGQSLQA